MELSTLTLSQLANLYNGAIENHSLPCKPTAKFKDKATGVARIEYIMAEYALTLFSDDLTCALVAMHPEKDATEDAEEAAAEMNYLPDADEAPAAGTLTDLQYRVMNRIAHDEYCTSNGATPTDHTDVTTWLWADEYAKDVGLTEQQVGGVLTSLENAGYISMYKAPKVAGQQDESTVSFTEAGFAAWQAVHSTPVNYAFNEGTNSAGEPAAPVAKAKRTKKAKATEAAPAAKKARGPKAQFADEQVITVLVENPKRVGSDAHKRYALYVTGMTVREALTAGLTRADFKWDTDRGHIDIV